MQKRVYVKTNKQGKSDTIRESVMHAATDFEEYRIFSYNGYGGWLFESGYDTPDNPQTQEELTFRCKVFYEFNGFEPVLVWQRNKTITSKDKDGDTLFQEVQDLIDFINDEIEEKFWPNIKQLRPPYPKENNLNNPDSELEDIHKDFNDELKQQGFDPDIELDRG